MGFFIILFLITASYTLCSLPAHRSKVFDPQNQVLSTLKFVVEIGSYLQNPYTNLALVNKQYYGFFRKFTPGAFLVNRFHIQELAVVTNFDKDAKFFLNITRGNYLCATLPYLYTTQSEQQNQPPLLSSEGQRTLLMGAFKVLIVDSVVCTTNVLNYSKALFCTLLHLQEYEKASRLFDKFEKMRFPASFEKEHEIHIFLNTRHMRLIQDLERFHASHYPAIFSFCLAFYSSANEANSVLEKLNSSTRGLLPQLYERLIDFCKAPAHFSHLNPKYVYQRNVVIINRLNYSYNESDHLRTISFLRDLNSIRFKNCWWESRNIPEMVKYLEQKSYNSIKNHMETLLIVVLRTKIAIIFLKIVKECSLNDISTEFKLILREYPNTIELLPPKILLKLHANDYGALFETLIMVGGKNAMIMETEINNEMIIQAALSQIKQDLCFGFSDCLKVLQHLCNSNFIVPLESLSQSIGSLLDIMTETEYVNVKNVTIGPELFLKLVQSQGLDLSILERIRELGVYWEIDTDTLVFFLDPANTNDYNLLLEKKRILLGNTTFNLIKLVPLVSLDSWISRFCPLFDLNVRTQFEHIEDAFWSDIPEILKELGSVFTGKSPVLSYKKWNILPSLAMVAYKTNLKASELFRLWSRACVMTFIMYVPKDLVLAHVNPVGAINKWLLKRPEDMKFNSKFISVFLHEGITINFESLNLEELQNYRNIIQYIGNLGSIFMAKITHNIDWISVINLIETQEKFRELISLTSHNEVLNAFNQFPQLQQIRVDLYMLLFSDIQFNYFDVDDFDFDFESEFFT